MKMSLTNSIIAVIIIIVISLIYVIYLTPSAFKERKNVKNSKFVRVGMNKKTVIDIMGEPDDRIKSFNKSSDSAYYYRPPFAASSGIYFFIDTDNKVNGIIHYE